MRVLVLGATGRLGQMTKWAWKGRLNVQSIWHMRKNVPPPEWVSFDILTDKAALAEACANADAVLNLTGIVPARPEDLHLNRQLAEAVQQQIGARPHFLASSASVYGRAGGLCREEDSVHPVAPYGQAKLDMERAVLAMPQNRVTCLRIGNVAGADQILGGAAQGRAMVLDQFDDGTTPKRSYIGPMTLGRVLGDLLQAAGQGADLPGVINIAAPGAVEMGALLDAGGWDWTARPAPPTAIGEVTLDITRLSRFTRLDPVSGTAPALVAEWRAYEQAQHLTP